MIGGIIRVKRSLCVTVLALALLPVGADAQAIRCSAFLHNRDGSWTSFFKGHVMGERGPIPVAVGERFTRRGRTAKSEIARALDALCQPE